jgi:uncharacterized protein (TIGR02246 family)
MRVLSMLIVLLTVGVAVASGAQPEPDEAAIRRVFADFSRIWDEPGMPGFENLFTEDADFVVITGRWLKGRSEIVAYHRELLKTVYAGSKTLPGTLEKIRFVRPDFAITHWEGGATFELDGKTATRTGRSTAVLVKQDGGWRITAFHNTLTSGPGALPNRVPSPAPPPRK